MLSKSAFLVGIFKILNIELKFPRINSDFNSLKVITECEVSRCSRNATLFSNEKYNKLTLNNLTFE